MGHVAETLPIPGESSESYARRVIAEHHAYRRELAWQSLIALLGIPVLIFLLALIGVFR